MTRLFRCEVCRCQYCFSYSRLTSKVTPPASHGYTLRVAALPPVVTRASRVLCSRRARPSFVRPWSMGSKARRRFSYSRRTSPPYPLSYSVNFFLFSSQRKAPATIRPRTG
ncbi:hypothetical protein [Bacteroides intestinalis]|uniref:hypothetical protein n=1 Tax=Bacteroides intestinalis TaxID=329854 RepID=UPI00196108C3|nr:hypothetical protein [Bacteroides intestinalis]